MVPGVTSGMFLRITQNGELCYSRCFRFRCVWANVDDGGVDCVDKMKESLGLLHLVCTHDVLQRCGKGGILYLCHPTLHCWISANPADEGVRPYPQLHERVLKLANGMDESASVVVGNGMVSLM